MIVGKIPKSTEAKRCLEAHGIEVKSISQGVDCERFADFCVEIRPRVVVLYCQDIPGYGMGIINALRHKIQGGTDIFGLFDSYGNLDEGIKKLEAAEVATFVSCPMPAKELAATIKSRWYGEAKRTPPPLPAPRPASPPTKGIQRNPPLLPKPVICSIVGKHDQMIYIDPRRVRPLPDQPRGKSSPGFSLESIAELGTSMRENGQIESASVCPLVGDPLYDAQLIDGERRLRGSLSAEIMLRVAVREDVAPEDARDLYLLSVIGNTGKEPPTTSELIHIVRRLRGAEYDFTQARVGTILGFQGSWVSQLESLGRLDPTVLALLDVGPSEQTKKSRRKGKLTVQIALLLVDLEPAKQLELSRHIVEENLSYEQTKRYVLQVRRELGLLRTASGRVRQSERFNVLGALTRRNIDAYGVYGDIPTAEWESFINDRPSEERDAVSRDLRALAVSLNKMADRICEV
ncbi:MAG: ParB N-terminal domain-containing protein [Candidatus Paceibacterota bacterium]|jgi:ParB/RepB/Spo0J family partition protein